MFEQFRSFADYIKDYDLQRAEGLLLRHLSRVHKVLTQTVPDTAKNETVRDMELYLATMIRQIDSSLLDEWERMRDPNYQAVAVSAEIRPPGAEEAAARYYARHKSIHRCDPGAHFHFPTHVGQRRFRKRSFRARLTPGTGRRAMDGGRNSARDGRIPCGA